MLNFTLNLAEQGLRKVLKKYQILALRYLWEVGEQRANSRAVVEAVNEQLLDFDKVSRASIILFLNKMVEQGVLGFRDATGKGGHQKQYYPLMYEKEYIKQVASTVIENLLKDFPEATRAVLEEYP
jgi:predicted transcriptional regulator